MRKIIFIIALIIISFPAKSQIYSDLLNDYIITTNNDTIKCNITYIDDLYIFYKFFNLNLKYKKSYIQLLKVKSYKIKDSSKNVMLPSDTSYYPPITKYMSFGLGAGLNYGGFGGCVTGAYEIAEVFFGAGYNLLEAGCNFGLLLRCRPKKEFCPYIGGMYGYNAVIKIKGTKQIADNPYNKTYYGPSFCVGFEVFTEKRNKYFNFALVLPVRPWEFDNDLTNLQHDPKYVIFNEPLPFSISVGFHFL